MTREAWHPARLVVMALIIGVSIFFWNSPVLLPAKLLAVMGHETGHALASLLAGGSVTKVTIASNESGACLSQLPDGFFAKTLVYSAGYVGSALISVVLLVATFRFRARRAMLAVASLWLALMMLLYARDLFTIGFCLGFSLLFAAGARWLPEELVAGVNLFLATFTSLYAAMDLRDDLWNSAVRAESDAQLLANVTPIPALVWAALWTLASVVLLLVGGYLAARGKPVAATVTPSAVNQPRM